MIAAPHLQHEPRTQTQTISKLINYFDLTLSLSLISFTYLYYYLYFCAYLSLSLSYIFLSLSKHRSLSLLYQLSLSLFSFKILNDINLKNKKNVFFELRKARECQIKKCKNILLSNGIAIFNLFMYLCVSLIL